ncbi:MAG: hypothetical protein NTW06_02605, partial [Candidatus Falkowbacteria bacterium]|nr:hypothetical protein [Candidatus Falkowbacteria bacterium]
MFFRKKSEDKIIAADVAAAKIGESVEKNIGVYTMPKRFLGKKPDADQAKTTGLLILISGFIILLAGAGFCYWFYFLRTPTTEINI